MGSLLTLQDASFGYGSRAVVSAVDLRVEPGEFLGIVGPNGAGKTTLFRGILGLIPARSGRVERAATALGYVPQRESLDPLYPLRTEEVARMGAWGRQPLLRLCERSLHGEALAALARVGLREQARDPFAALSGGQRQRALIARALMTKPQLLLLDEPTSGVDRDAAQVLLELLQDLNRHDGIAILLVSHQLAFLRAAAREVLWVEHGRVLRGPTATFLDSARVARAFASVDP